MSQGRPSPASDIRIIVERPEFLLLEGDEEQIDEHERELNERVLDIDVVLSDTGADVCTIRINNTDLFVFFMYVILPGNAWWVKITSNDYYEDATALSTRRFRIQKVSGYRTLTFKLVSAEADLDIKKDNKRTFSNVTVSDAVAQLGAELGVIPPALLQPATQGGLRQQRQDTAARKRVLGEDFIFPTIAKYASLVQSKESDAAFLTKMARKVGYVWWLEEESRPTRDGRVGKLKRKLRFMPRTFDPDVRPLVGVISSQYGNNIGELIGDPEFLIDYEDNVFFAHGGTNNFWSPLSKKFSEITTNLEKIERVASGQMTPVDPDNAVDFASTTETFLQRKEEADQLLAQFETSLIKVRLTMVGRWDVEPRRLVRFQGFGWVVNGVMWIEEVRHRASRGSTYQTELTLRANAMDISARDAVDATLKITALRDRFKRFDDEVLHRDGWVENEKGEWKEVRVRSVSPEKFEELAQAGYLKEYRHWFNMNGKR